MALNVGANQVEKALGHDDDQTVFTTDISNPNREGGKYADPSGEQMKALAWMGKGDVRVGMCFFPFLPPLFFFCFVGCGGEGAGRGELPMMRKTSSKVCLRLKT